MFVAGLKANFAAECDRSGGGICFDVKGDEEDDVAGVDAERSQIGVFFNLGGRIKRWIKINRRICIRRYFKWYERWIKRLMRLRVKPGVHIHDQCDYAGVAGLERAGIQRR